MQLFSKSAKQIAINTLAIIVFVSVSIVFQNCGNVHLAPISSNSVQCVLPDDIQDYSIALYNQTATSDSFQVVDSGGVATQISADWNDGVDRGNHVIFEADFSATAPCVTKVITAKFSMCSQNFTLTQNVTIGPNCVVTDPPGDGGGNDVCPASIPSSTTNPTPLTRQIRASIFYWDPHNPMAANTITNVDITNWDNLFGRRQYTDTTIIPFPGVSGAQPAFRDHWYSDTITPTFGRLNYVSLKFHVPTTTSTLRGMYTYATAAWSTGPSLTASITSACGNFVNVPTGCLKENFPARDDVMLNWQTTGTGGVEGNPSYCYLQPGADYYLNIKLADPSVVDPRCNATKCVTGLAHNHN